MENYLNYKNFECYWILIDILNSRPLEQTNIAEYQGYSKDHHETSKHVGMEVYYNVDRLKRSVKMAKISETDDAYFSEKYILLDDICDTSMVWSIGKIKSDIMKEVFSRHGLDGITLSKYKKNLWWPTWCQKYFGENIKSIFEYNAESTFASIKTPTLFYLKPVSAELEPSEIIEDQKKLDSIITQMHCHPTLWDVFEDTLILNLIHSDLFKDLLFLNLNKSDTDYRTISIPLSLYEIARQIAFCSWLDYQQHDLSEAIASKYNITDISKELKLRQISRIYNNMLLNQAPLVKTQNILTEYLVDVEEFQRYFIMIFTDILSHQKPEKKELSYWIISELHRRMLTQIEQINHQQKVLEKKSNEILAILRDRILLISTKVNLRLQWSMIILTIIITLLTLVLVVSDDTLSRILLKLFKAIFFLFSK